MVQERGKADGRIRLAIVGGGQIGRLHAQRIVADGRATIATVCDPMRANAARLQAESAPESQLFTDISEMAAAGSFDAAVICTPTHQHFEQARLLLGKGIPILCEKPLADSRARIVQLIDEPSAGGPALAVAYQRRCWAVYRTLRREVQSGRYGPVCSVTAHVAERWQQTIAGTW